MTNYSPKHFTPAIGSGYANGLTKEVAIFVSATNAEKIPTEVFDLAKKSILDGFGLALSGSVAASGKIVQAYLKENNCSGRSSVIGTDIKTSGRFAAFANGIGIHADDFDDTQLAVAEDRVYGLLTHPTASCLPAALSEAETGKLSGLDFLTAYVTGVEVECKIAEAISPRHYQHGFHSTATCGPFASASAVGQLRAYDEETMIRTLAITASQSGGLRENFGTMTKPFHAGRAAEAGIIACDFAKMGWTAAEAILEAPRGFFQAHGGGYDLTAIQGRLGRPWTFLDPGISIKPHPSGSLTHPGMTKMLELIAEHNIKAADVAAIDVGTNHNMLNALIHHSPENELQAKFSMEFCMAVILLEGKAHLAEFTDTIVVRPDIQEMIKRIHFSVHPDAEAAGYAKMTTIIDIHLRDGRTISGRADFGKGSPEYPYSYAEVAMKFQTCAEFAQWPKDKAKRVISLVDRLETLENLGELIASLVR